MQLIALAAGAFHKYDSNSPAGRNTVRRQRSTQPQPGCDGPMGEHAIMTVSVRLFIFGILIAPTFLSASAGDKQNGGRATGKGRAPVKLTEEALAIHKDALVFDGHNDLPWQMRERKDPFFRKFDLTRIEPLLHTDIPRLRKGDVGAQFWAAYVSAVDRGQSGLAHAASARVFNCSRISTAIAAMFAAAPLFGSTCRGTWPVM